MNKYERYRKKLRAEGKCPHCGKPCAPYYQCDARRKYIADRRRTRKVEYRPLGPREVAPRKFAQCGMCGESGMTGTHGFCTTCYHALYYARRMLGARKEWIDLFLTLQQLRKEIRNENRK